MHRVSGTAHLHGTHASRSRPAEDRDHLSQVGLERQGLILEHIGDAGEFIVQWAAYKQSDGGVSAASGGSS